MSPEPSTLNRPTRRWLQLSLRSSAILATAFCVWLGIQVNHARMQSLAVAALLRDGAYVSFASEWDEDAWGENPELHRAAWLRKLLGSEHFATAYSVSLPQTLTAPATDSMLRQLKYLPALRHIQLTLAAVSDQGLSHLRTLKRVEVVNLPTSFPEVARDISDDGIQHLGELTEMQSLALDNTSVTDNGLAHLSQLSKLHTVSLRNTVITSHGLSHIAALGDLVYLRLDSTNVGDEGLERIRDLTKLEHLTLNSTPVSDRGLATLSSMASLRIVSVIGTQVTQAGVEKLRAALPRCVVLWE